MNVSTENYTSSEVHPSTNITTQDILKPDSFKIFVTSLNLLFSLPTHSYVLWLLVIGSGNRIASEFFILNLSVCEIFFCLNSLVFLLSQAFPSFLTLQRFLIGLAITGRPLFQCLMCGERYLAVVHPVTFLKFKPLRYRVVCCAIVWIACLGSCLYCMFTLMLSNHYAYAWFYSQQLLLFLFIQLFCLSAVLRALKQSGPGDKGREREEENSIKRRAFYLIVISTVTTVIMFVPFIITGLLTLLQQQSASITWFFSFIFFVLAGFVQPVIYLHRNRKLLCLSIKSLVNNKKRVNEK